MYQLTLKKDTINRNKTTAIHILAAIVLIVTGFITLVTPFSVQIFMAGKENYQGYAPSMNYINYGGIGLMIIGLYIIVSLFFFTRKAITTNKNILMRIVEIISFATIMTISIVYNFYLSAIYAGIMLVLIAVIYYIEKVQILQNKLLDIDMNGIYIHSKIKNTHWKWEEIKKVILKNSVITIMLTNNTNYQLLLTGKEPKEEEINHFSSTQIDLFKDKRIQNDW